MTSHAKRFAVAAVAVVLALTGCSASGETTPTEAAKSTLTLTTPTPPISLDPAKTNNGLAEVFVDVAYDSLIHVTIDGTFEPAMAESWGYVGDGNLQFEITLRDDLKFADGTPLDSASVKAYMDYFKNDAQGPFAQTMGIIDRVETPDERTVMVYLNSPSPDLELQFAETGMWGAIISPAGLADPDSLGSASAGAGAYVLDTDRSVSGSSYVYTPNENYYAPDRQRWSEVTINVIADPNAALQSVTSGQSNWTAGTAEQVAAAEAAGLVVDQAVPNALIFFIQDRAGQVVPELADVRVRQAINYAIDREAIAEVIGGEPLEQIISPNRVGYNDDAESVYSYDPDQAKELLAAAGVPDGFTMPVIVGSFDPLGSRAIEIISEELAAVGITVEITTAPTFPDYAREQESGKYPATILPWGSTTMFTVAGQLVLPTGIVNPFKSSNDQFNALFEQAAGEPADEAAVTWQELSLAVTEEAWFAPIASVQSVYFGSEGINPAGDGFTSPNPLFF